MKILKNVIDTENCGKYYLITLYTYNLNFSEINFTIDDFFYLTYTIAVLIYEKYMCQNDT